MRAIFYNQYREHLHFLYFGGEEGIRTLDTVARIHDFESRAFDHSATSPMVRIIQVSILFARVYIDFVPGRGKIIHYEDIQ